MLRLDDEGGSEDVYKHPVTVKAEYDPKVSHYFDISKEGHRKAHLDLVKTFMILLLSPKMLHIIFPPRACLSKCSKTLSRRSLW